MARVATVVPDLLFGSKVLELLRAGGHEVVPAADAQVAVVDLTQGADPQQVVADLAGVPALGVFSHVEPEVREAALAAGFAQVVPRSRFMREGAALVDAVAR